MPAIFFGHGHVVHNLHAYAWGRQPAEPFDLRRDDERVTFPVNGMDGGSISMLSVQIG